MSAVTCFALAHSFYKLLIAQSQSFDQGFLDHLQLYLFETSGFSAFTLLISLARFTFVETRRRRS